MSHRRRPSAAMASAHEMCFFFTDLFPWQVSWVPVVFQLSNNLNAPLILPCSLEVEVADHGPPS